MKDETVSLGSHGVTVKTTSLGHAVCKTAQLFMARARHMGKGSAERLVRQVRTVEPASVDGVARVLDDAPLQSQFCLPRGVLGRVVGWVMARENDRMNRATVDTVRAGPEDHVLEIGFGPGQAIELLVKRSAARWIAGVDPSDVMIDQATALNQDSIEAGRVALFRATAEQLPFPDGSFSKAFAINNFQIWSSPQAGLVEVRRVLKPAGTLVLCLRRAAKRPHFWTSPGLTPAEIDDVRRMLERNGFDQVRVVHRRLAPRTVCLLASKPAGKAVV
jgi:SAM-dependent methyltransferase